MRLAVVGWMGEELFDSWYAECFGEFSGVHRDRPARAPACIFSLDPCRLLRDPSRTHRKPEFIQSIVSPAIPAAAKADGDAAREGIFIVKNCPAFNQLEMAGPVTQKEIARSLGLHPSTVCLALKRDPRVPRSTLEEVLGGGREARVRARPDAGRALGLPERPPPQGVSRDACVAGQHLHRLRLAELQGLRGLLRGRAPEGKRARLPARDLRPAEAPGEPGPAARDFPSAQHPRRDRLPAAADRHHPGHQLRAPLRRDARLHAEEPRAPLSDRVPLRLGARDLRAPAGQRLQADRLHHPERARLPAERRVPFRIPARAVRDAAPRPDTAVHRGLPARPRPRRSGRGCGGTGRMP